MKELPEYTHQQLALRNGNDKEEIWIAYKGLISAVWGMYIHCNVDIQSGWLQKIINGPEMHRWHHSDDSNESHNKNFSTKIAVWDWLFNTAYFPKEKKANTYGLSDTAFPSNYFKQHIFAFRKFKNRR